MAAKYRFLELYLKAAPSHVKEIVLSFPQLEVILRRALPRSAYAYRPWWGNQTVTSTRPQAHAWTAAGFLVDTVKPEPSGGGWVRFKRK